MNVSITDLPSTTGEACAIDRSCVADSGCGCSTTKHAASHDDPPRRKTLSRAGIVGLLCVLGCAAAPLAIGGVAAATGALSGEAWIMAVGLVVAAVVYAYRRKTGKRGC